MLDSTFPPKVGSHPKGELSEWFKEHDWKSCIGQKPIGGSNPPLSASNSRKSLKFNGLRFARFLYPFWHPYSSLGFRRSIANIATSPGDHEAYQRKQFLARVRHEVYSHGQMLGARRARAII